MFLIIAEAESDQSVSIFVSSKTQGITSQCLIELQIVYVYMSYAIKDDSQQKLMQVSFHPFIRLLEMFGHQCLLNLWLNVSSTFIKLPIW